MVAVKNTTITNLVVRALTEVDRTVYASWDYIDSKKHTDKFEYEWYYQADGVWIPAGSNGSVDYSSWTRRTPATGKKVKYFTYVITYNFPENADKLRLKVKPVSKQDKEVKVGKRTVKKVWWTKTWTVTSFNVPTKAFPAKPSAPETELQPNGVTIKATLNTYDPLAKVIEFEFYDNTSNTYVRKKATVTANRASFDYVGAYGRCYKVRCRGVGEKGLLGEFSEYSEDLYTATDKMRSAPRLRALSASSIEARWSSVANAVGYEVQWTTNKDYFTKAPSQVQSDSPDGTSTVFIAEGLDSGVEYFFRVRSKSRNDSDEGLSAWSPISSCVVGKVPSPPTTWSSTSVTSPGKNLYLYWTHNSEDNSRERNAEVSIQYNDGTPQIKTVTNPAFSDLNMDDTGTHNLRLDIPASLPTDSLIKWKVRTRGIVTVDSQHPGGYSDWSITREINAYVNPTLNMKLGWKNRWFWDDFEFSEDTSIYTAKGYLEEIEDDTLRSLPLIIALESLPLSQTPTHYNVTITANDQYDDIDSITAKRVYVAKGATVFSKYADTPEHTVTLVALPSDVSLHNGMEYTVTATVAMDSGLTAEVSKTFTVEWDIDSMYYDINANFLYDEESVSMYITPYCIDSVPIEEEEEEEEEGDEPEPIDFEDTYPNVSLAVYREQADGSFVEIASNISNILSTTIVDPHPTLGETMYRIVATELANGRVYFEDCPGEEVPEKSIILQWDEEWYNFEELTVGEDTILQTPPAVSMLKLPYNIDVQDTTDQDVEFVQYIGRKHPVSYYGTHLGETASWKCEIPATDTDTIQLLRRLQAWMGDVYVREPSGLGYWAHVVPSFSLEHCQVTIPVTFDITRVEGGM